ncbi:hypothetical protein KP77_06340 [Jeotgalibacillus alimentarius]|uniref:DUF4870 domain-containing protein n=1 Tax=Jeotgalibacillus alimentarius TaxID=135826 RepID=A0A0C2VUM7_9BACL|nr:DUF4870 domain-containing protein [Jeotgalibacillus alimentarius]KIL52607.1 hypothetical protein KP77_06340 [Jeotgalibacillus alimentarius]
MHSSEDRLVAALMYFTSTVTFIVGPLILWLIKRDAPFVREHGYVYLNFAVSYFLYQAFAGFFYFIGIGWVINSVLTVLWIVFAIIAGLYALRGDVFKIPLVIRFFTPD